MSPSSTTAPGRSSSRALRLTVVATVLLTIAVLPFGGRELGAASSFLPALLAVVGCLDVLSVALLVGEFYDEGDRRVLVMAAAYGWSLATMVGYACAFPGVVSTTPPLAITPSMAPWLYIAWHGGFPVLLGAAWLPAPARWSSAVPARSRRRQAWGTLLVALAVGAATVAGIALSVRSLPVLISGLDTSAMTRVTAPFTVPLTALALVVAARGTRGRTGPERWAPVVVLVCLADLALTYTSRHRFSLGWYAGRTLTLVAAGLVVLATLASLRRTKSRALVDAHVDSLTQLANRRSADRELQLLLSLARRHGTPLAVVVLDIDHFKQINDQHGHAQGDVVLQALGLALPGWLRASDLAARVGGEEFLLVLPNTTARGAKHLAEVVRESVARMPGLPITVSLGVAELGPDDAVEDLLGRADQALYLAKGNGRNQAVVVPQPRRPASLPAAPGSAVPGGGGRQH